MGFPQQQQQPLTIFHNSFTRTFHVSENAAALPCLNWICLDNLTHKHCVCVCWWMPLTNRKHCQLIQIDFWTGKSATGCLYFEIWESKRKRKRGFGKFYLFPYSKQTVRVVGGERGGFFPVKENPGICDCKQSGPIFLGKHWRLLLLAWIVSEFPPSLSRNMRSGLRSSLTWVTFPNFHSQL